MIKMRLVSVTTRNVNWWTPSGYSINKSTISDNINMKKTGKLSNQMLDIFYRLNQTVYCLCRRCRNNVIFPNNTVMNNAVTKPPDSDNIGNA